MAIKINFDLVNNPELSTFILAKKNCDKIGMLDVVNPVLDANLNNASEITFDVYKTVDGKDCAIWDEITDFKLVWCKEWDAWFEITVEINDSDKNNIYKSVIGKSLCESELSQVSLHNIEINTEDDIARDDYEKPTVFYNENPEISLLNRITEKIPHYHLGHIDNSLKNVQKTFSFDNITIYDALQEIAEEVGCIFIFDSGTDAETGKAARTIKAYDLMTYCKHCGNRDTFETKCPNCGTENTDYFILPYSQMQDDGGSPFKDTTIYISKDNFADEILYSVNTDKVKNCFKLVAGDDLMTATIKSCNPNGSEYIWYISDSMKKDMSDELKTKIEEYDALYDGYRSGSNFRCQSSDSSGDYYIPAYLLDYYDDYYDEYHELDDNIKPIGDAEDITNFTKLTAAYYNTVDMLMLLENSLMPIGSQYEDAQEVVDSLYANLIQPVPMTILNATTKDVVVENAVKYMVEAVIDPYYGVTVVTNTIDKRNDIPYRWYGNIIITNINDSEDTATYTDLRLDLCDYTDCSAAYISQKIQTAIKTSSVANYGVNQLFAFYTENDGKNIGEFKMSLSDFKKKLKLYSLNNLVSFQDACQSVLDILAEQGVGNKTSGYTGLYSNSSTSNYTLYNDYYKRWKALETELNERETQIAHMEALQGYIVDIRNTIQDILNFEKFLAADLWKEFSSFRREDTYSNSNYISEGLNNSELIAWATEFIEVATKELYKSGELQHSISSSLKNLLLMKEFKPLVDYFELGNYIRVKIDDEVYRLRLIEYKIDWDNLDDIYVEFSDITRVVDGMTDLESLLNQSRSMATSYGNVQRQAKRGNKGYGRLTDWVDNGLDVTNQKIVNEVDNNVMSWDAHGILMREYDPVTETYANKQVKITNKGLYVTDDAWESAKVGVGNFIYYDPKEEEYYETFGVIADTLVGNLILSKEVGIYSEKNDITLNDSGIIISNAPYAEYSTTGETKIVINPNSDSPFRITHGTHSVIRVDNDGTLYINRKLNVHDAFKVNNSGDIDMDGDITMDGNIYIKGNITWGNETGVIQTLYSSQEDKSAPTHPYSYYSLTSSSGDSSWHRQFSPSRDKCIARYIYDEENDEWAWFVEKFKYLTHIDAGGIYTGTIYADNIQGGHISTATFTKNDANNDYGYMELYKQMIFFNENDADNTKGDTKMAIGFLKGSQYNEPIIVMGAGDGSGSNVAYINKSGSEFNIIYKVDNNTAAYMKMYGAAEASTGTVAGTVRINGVNFPPQASDTVQFDMIEKASYWNKKLDAIKETVRGATRSVVREGDGTLVSIPPENLGELFIVEGTTIKLNPNVVLSWNAVYALYGKNAYATPTNAYSTYPNTSSTAWHKTLDSSNDYYASYSYDGGNTWSTAVKVQGSDGSDGADGHDGSDANVPNYIKSTYIDFDEVASPQIKGNFIMGGKVYGGEYWNTDEKAYIKVGTSTGNYGDFALYSKNNVTPRYQIYDNASSIDFKALGTQFMYTSGSRTYPRGTWDFSGATVTGLSASTAPKFG